MKVKNRSGRNTFDFILSQFRQCYHDLEPFFMGGDIADRVCNNHLNNLKGIMDVREGIIVNNWIRVDIAYIIIFIGLNSAGQKAIKNILKPKYQDEFVKSILFFLSKKPHLDSDYYTKWKAICHDPFFMSEIKSNYSSLHSHQELSKNPDFSELIAAEKKIEKKYFKYYGGHQYKLSHYYRHLYQTMKFIDDKNILTYKEKYHYASILRAQLSTPEQMLFFINSISSLGWEWELDHVINKKPNKHLITKYNLIKNIVDLTIDGITDVKGFYPDVNFQFEGYPKNRRKLERFFKH